MSDNCLFAFPDRIIPTPYVTPVLSGGSWINSGDVHLSNLQDPDLATVARSTNAAPTSTIINIDFGAIRDIRVPAILRHNLTLSATVQYLYHSDSGRTALVYDSGALPVWMPFYPMGTLPWGHPSLWDGKISVEDQSGYQFDFIRAFPESVIARYGQIKINDPDNPDGYVELVRLIQAPAWQPETNMSYGATVKWASDATSERSKGGVRFIEENTKWREISCTLGHMTPGVAMVCVMEMQRRLGRSGELVFVSNPSDQSQAEWQRSILCNLEELDPITFAGFNNTTAGFKLLEVI